MGRGLKGPWEGPVDTSFQRLHFLWQPERCARPRLRDCLYPRVRIPAAAVVVIVAVTCHSSGPF